MSRKLIFYKISNYSSLKLASSPEVARDNIEYTDIGVHLSLLDNPDFDVRLWFIDRALRFHVIKATKIFFIITNGIILAKMK
jgi:hypothetical protein